MLSAPVNYNARKHFCFLVTLVISFLLLLLINVQDVNASTVTIYPAPESLSSNSDFQVWVEGSQSPVWSVPGLTGSSRAVTSFAFSGSVTVTVQYKANFTSAQIMPSQFGISYTKPAANQLQFTLSGDYTKSKVIIRIDNDTSKELFLFGDPPVATPPPGAIVYNAGAHYPTDYALTMSDNQTIFLMPGAVLHARIDTMSHSNLKILGPGIVVAHNSGVIPGGSPWKNNIDFYECNNVELRDFILVRDFNDDLIHELVVRNTDNVTINNVKVISDARCSDGLALGGNNTVNVDNFFDCSGDNNLVIGWWGRTDNVEINNFISYFPENSTIAQTAAVFPQGIDSSLLPPGVTDSSIGSVHIKNLYCIKQTNVIGSIWGNVWNNVDDFSLENVYCEAGSTRDNFMDFELNTSLNKNFTFKNVYFDKSSGGIINSPYYARFDNVHYSTGMVDSVTGANYTGTGTVQILNGTSGTHYELENGTLVGAGVNSKSYGSAGKAVCYMDPVGNSVSIPINVPTAGNYNLDICYANGSSANAARSIYVNGIHSFDVSLPVTGGWDTSSSWVRLANVGTVNLNAGTNYIKIQTDSGDLSTADFDYIEVYTPQTVPGKIKAVNYNGMYGVDAESTSDIDGGMHLGYIDPGDWIDYKVNVASTGTYTVKMRVASPSGPANAIQIKSGTTVLATVNVPNTGGYQNWQTIVSSPINLSAGIQTLRIYANTGGWNFNWMNIAKRYECENGTLVGAGVNSKSYGSAGKAVCYMDPVGNSVSIPINVPTAGNYNLDICYANGSSANATRSIYVNGIHSFDVSLPVTGGWDTSSSWVRLANVGTVNLNAGTNYIKIQTDSGDLSTADFDYIEVYTP